jgi:hypothetical protein
VPSFAGRLSPASLALPLIVLVQLALPVPALAQAWLPLRGEGTLSLTGQHIRLSGHFDTDGSRLEDCGPSRAWLAIAEFEYGVTDKLAFTARLPPFVASRLSGAEDDPCIVELRALYDELHRQDPTTPLNPVAIGGYYSTFQDFGLTLRYNVLDKRGVAVTPVAGVTIPSHHYETIGEVAAGQDLFTVHTGVNVGVLFARRTYAHARYTYSFVQQLRGIPLDRSNAEFEAGYAVTPRLSLRGLAAWQRTHGGITYSESIARGFGGEPEVFFDHDRTLATRYWHVGGGTTVTLTDSIDVQAAVLTFVAGSESHYGVGLTAGVTWKVLSARLPSPSIARR